MTGFEPATLGATFRSDERDEVASGQFVRTDYELPTEPNQGSDDKDPQ